MTFESMDDVRRANQQLGHHWFDADTLRGFKSRVGKTLYGGRYFISSENGGPHIWNGKRRYSVRRVNPNGSIDTVGEFGQFATGRQAAVVARYYAKVRGQS